jgi:PEP-CTERM/exosortase A-associated glycosyltransferase
MRILHILDHSIPLQSGYTFRSRAIFREQKNLGWTTFHLTGPKHALNAEDNPPEEFVDGLLFYRTEPDNGYIAKLPVIGQLSLIRALKKRLEDIVSIVNPDILHAHSPALNGVAALAVARKYGIPVVYEVRGFWEDAAVSHGTSRQRSLRYYLAKTLETWVLKRVDAATCICDGIKRDLIQRGLPQEKITIIPNAVDPERFQINSKRDRELETSLGLVNSPVIGFVGSFYAYEGLQLLLDAMPILLGSKPGLKLLLIGGGQEFNSLREQAKKEGIDNAVVFTGRVPHDQVERYYSLIDIMCYPRLSMRLTELVTPLKPLEAMAQQKMIIASDIGGHRELIEDEDSRILFKAGNASDLAAKVLYLLDHKEIWQDIVESGRKFVEKERTWPASVMRYTSVYKDLCPDCI